MTAARVRATHKPGRVTPAHPIVTTPLFRVKSPRPIWAPSRYATPARLGSSERLSGQADEVRPGRGVYRLTPGEAAALAEPQPKEEILAGNIVHFEIPADDTA